MKNCLQIFPKEESPIDILMGEDTLKITITPFPFDRNEIADASSEDEIIWNNLLEQKLSEQTYDVIIIDHSVRDEEATIIIAQIRLSSEKTISKLPIVFYNKKKLAKTLSNATLKHKGTLINCNVNYLWQNNYKDDTGLAKKLQRVISNNTEPQSVDISLLNFRQNDEGTRHQITNEWGAFQLADIAGLDNLAARLFNENPKSKTIYFKYLKLKHRITFPSTANEFPSTGEVPIKTKKYLFIDDNYDKGWLEVFNGILEQVDSELELEAYTDIIKFEDKSKEEDTFQEIIDQIKLNGYQGILLDLRLTNEDNSTSKLNTNIIELTGGKLLKRIKDTYPYLPVIMTTASNKAWNMEQLLNEGADGYFIKQGPDSLPNVNMAKENYDSFVKLIKASQKKYKRLQPFWQYIKNITEGTLIEERDIQVVGLSDKQTTNVEKRINERLYMFFGLLKRSFEDSKYNKKFHYSDLKLAFMTLWSCLNDIQYIYYDKSEEWTSNGKTKKSIRIEGYLESQLSLPNSSNLDIYLQDRNGSLNNFKSCLKVDYNIAPYYTLESTPVNNINYTTSIGEQIGFLILTFNRGRITDTSSGQQSAELLVKSLVEIKDQRNKLFLTHGNEDNGSDFFIKTEKENIQIELEDCAKLFEIVYFLLKGDLIKLNLA
jgi:CheY-like chemotaxis protein